jgi:membrane-bound lytic murein transglycosylase B
MQDHVAIVGRAWHLSAMLTRRLILGRAAALPGLSASLAAGLTAGLTLGMPGRASATGSFDAFLDGVRADARRAGVSPGTLNRAFAGLRPNDRVLELDRRQPESAMGWEQYRDRIVSQTRIDNGRRAVAENRSLLEAIGTRYRVSPRVVVAIWGMETNYGTNTGGFGVVEALATLAWEGRRASYFRSELLAALRVLEGGHVRPERMRGSWAGAMGQPQFMPSNFERLAVDFDGDGRRDIWDSRADALASIANYLARHGWREGEPWGFEVLPPPGFILDGADTETRRPAREWARFGFRNINGGPLPASELEMTVVVPNRSGGQVFLGAHNLRAIRRYNPPVNYGLAVGLLSDQVA